MITTIGMDIRFSHAVTLNFVHIFEMISPVLHIDDFLSYLLPAILYILAHKIESQTYVLHI